MFTARSPGVARWAGTAAGVYCLLYGVAGAVIGMSAKVLLPNLDAADDAFAHVVEATMPALLAGLVLAAALSAVMSTSSGAQIATRHRRSASSTSSASCADASPGTTTTRATPAGWWPGSASS